MSKKRNKQHFDFSTTDENLEVRPLSGYPERDDAPEPYSGNWPEISLAYRTSVAWMCEECGDDMDKQRGMLHTHHCDGNPWNHDWTNLKALCKKCHDDVHGRRVYLD